MKTNRQKKAKKNLSFYINNFKFRQPYQILIDGTFAFTALESKFNIQDQLAKYFQSEVKLLSTACVIAETEILGNFKSAINGATQIVKQYRIHKCGHEKKPRTGAQCLRSMVGKGNNSRYIIATQDREFQDILRKIPGVPILYLHGKAPTLEAPTEASLKEADNIQKTLGISTWEKENLTTLKKVAGITEENVEKHKKRKKKGPNPLSCLKKKKKVVDGVHITGKVTKKGKTKKKRKIKIAAHIKEALMHEVTNKSIVK